MEYEFGVMSNKFSLEAINDDIAYVTMVMHIANSRVPIVLYKPTSKVIDAKVVMDMDDFGLFIEKNREALVKANESIKKLS